MICPVPVRAVPVRPVPVRAVRKYISKYLHRGGKKTEINKIITRSAREVEIIEKILLKTVIKGSTLESGPLKSKGYSPGV